MRSIPPVSFWGVESTSVWISSNGRIDFAPGDGGSYAESPLVHFDLPRVSVFFDDFVSAEGSAIVADEYPDRVTVTWLAMAEFGDGGASTFQAQLFRNGDIALGYLTLDAPDGLVGVSDGNPSGSLNPDSVDLVP